MDFLTALAASMLPASRAKVGSAFKAIQHRTNLSLRETLASVLHACDIPEPDWDEAINIAVDRATEAMASAPKAGLVALTAEDPRFPALLTCIPDPPPVLWCAGDPDLLSKPTVAVVGSRAATAYALDVASRIAEELSACGLVVASGLARGVDSAAHRGCMRGSSPTVAVLGSGLDRIYPAEHRPLADEISKKGLLVSELGPGAAPLPEHFPLRNRIISGISLGVVVVEASEKSGSLITARCALEQGRDVMAVPGSVLSGRNRGSHSLLKDGAKVVESAVDILEGLGWPTPAAAAIQPSKVLNSDSLLSRMEFGAAYRLEELMELTGVTGTRLLPRLMELELAGLVTHSGSVFSRRLVT
jgi:DNA processing protein